MTKALYAVALIYVASTQADDTLSRKSRVELVLVLSSQQGCALPQRGVIATPAAITAVQAAVTGIITTKRRAPFRRHLWMGLAIQPSPEKGQEKAFGFVYPLAADQGYPGRGAEVLGALRGLSGQGAGETKGLSCFVSQKADAKPKKRGGG
jgi:hypothetical protein